MTSKQIEQEVRRLSEASRERIAPLEARLKGNGAPSGIRQAIDARNDRAAINREFKASIAELGEDARRAGVEDSAILVAVSRGLWGASSHPESARPYLGW